MKCLVFLKIFKNVLHYVVQADLKPSTLASVFPVLGLQVCPSTAVCSTHFCWKVHLCTDFLDILVVHSLGGYVGTVDFVCRY